MQVMTEQSAGYEVERAESSSMQFGIEPCSLTIPTSILNQLEDYLELIECPLFEVGAGVSQNFLAWP